MIDWAFTTAHRLFSHIDCQACVWLCVNVCMFMCVCEHSLRAIFFLMATAERELCTLLVSVSECEYVFLRTCQKLRGSCVYLLFEQRRRRRDRGWKRTNETEKEETAEEAKAIQRLRDFVFQVTFENEREQSFAGFRNVKLTKKVNLKSCELGI